MESLKSLIEQSPFIQAFGIELTEVEAQQGTLRMTMPLSERAERAIGSRQFHGGAIAGLIDTAATFALAMESGRPAPTANLRVDYLLPAKDTRLQATARVRRSGKHIGVVDVDVHDLQRRLVAIGRASISTNVAGGEDRQ